jgi:hypothetical protein
MPKRSLVSLECELCGRHESFNVTDPAEQVLPIIARWKGVMDGDAPPGTGSDTLRWYDTTECLLTGERNYAQRKAEEDLKSAELNQKLAVANEAMKKTPFMVKQ